MEVKTKILVVLAGLLALLLLFLGVYGAVRDSLYKKQVKNLQNQIASRDVTAEVQKGLYVKATLQASVLQNLLDQKDSQVKELENQVKKDKADLVVVTSIGAKFKKAYEDLANAKQNTEPGQAGGPSRDRVEFSKDFGYLGVSGYTLTNPATAWVRVQQNRPLRITLGLAEQKDHSWKTYATSSEENVAVDIQVAGVNPLALEPKWYEGLEVHADVGGGKTGVLAGVGLGIKVKNFTMGPSVWATAGNGFQTFYGLNFAWRPFERN